jgi:peptidyl-prolyl cis-trans isomerase B (cyclophilin B)
VFGEAPNGTGFTITLNAEPTLDATNLVVGRVVEGLEVVQAIGALPYARPRDSAYDAPFFNVSVPS